MKKLERHTFIIAVFIIAALASCVQDLDGGKEKSGDGTALVTLSLSTPASRTTRAPGDPVPGSTAENVINEIDVLLFSADESFHYRAHGVITNNADATKTFTVKLPTGTRDVVILANARAAIATAITTYSLDLPISTVVAGGPSRSTVLNSITATVTGKINTTGFPMWGYHDDLLVDASSPSPATTIALTRAVARVDVSVKSDVSGFTLDSVLLYNYYTTGHVAPEAVASGSGYKSASYPVATSKQVNKHLDYIATGGSCIETIYAFEAPAGLAIDNSTTGWVENTCLVVGGKFGSSTAPLTYYRVDLVNALDAPLALARNHLYDVVIQDVNDHGWPTPWLAYTNKPSNITVEILEWNDGEMNEVVFNGQYSLTVDKSRLKFYKEGIAKSMTIFTTYHPGGWTVEDLPSWLEVIDIVPAAGVKSTLTLQVKSTDPLTTPSREDKFYIVAGNLRKEITVTQVDEVEFWIAITNSSGEPITELVFEAGDASTAPVEQFFRVTWLPATAACSVTATSVGALAPFNFGTGDNPTTVALVPGIQFTIEPPYNSSSSARVTRVDFTVTDDTRSVMLPLYLRQEAGTATYAFSADGTILTLFSNFDRGEKLELSPDDIPELATASIAEAVTRLVIQGDDLTGTQVSGIMNNDGLLPNLAHVSLPDFTGNIPDRAFEYCDWLTSFESLANSIGYQAFYFCSNLTSVYLPKVKTLENGALRICMSLTSVYLPEVEFVDMYAFGMCWSLKTVDLPAAETIEHAAFGDCIELETVDLPVAGRIGDQVFDGCSSLKIVRFGYQEEINWGDYVFNQIPTTDVDLHLGTREYNNNVTGGTTWKGYTFKSITCIP